jgi:hypothetical protein
MPRVVALYRYPLKGFRSQLGTLLTTWTNSSLARPIIKPRREQNDRRFLELVRLVNSVPHLSPRVPTITAGRFAIQKWSARSMDNSCAPVISAALRPPCA